MRVAVIADQELVKCFNDCSGVQLTHHHAINEIDARPDVIFYLLDEETLPGGTKTLTAFDCPVIVNAVCTTLDALPERVSRINAWPGFLQRPLKEVVIREADKWFLTELFALFNWQYRFVEDTPGMITARIVAMIINEAWFAYEDGVSTKEAIDLAMKLGTNYPYGPFEWGSKIGLKKIASLLTQLSETEPRFTPAPLLIKSVNPWR
ncbi:MAG: hypothetical protein LH478_03740 [Chitinophagaceae bacterium]|nr:hypothetical protein [Chitinophagaceae bacterium]